jgi:hypothetical protein
MMLKNAMAGPSSLDLTAYALLQQMVWLGVTYRTGVTLFNKNVDSRLEKPSAIVVGAQFFFKDQFRIGYTYDRSLKTTATLGASSHEISIGFLFPRRDEQMLTPRFF